MNQPAATFAPFVALARVTLGDGLQPGQHEAWVEPLAKLLEAASRGVGQLSSTECPLPADASPQFFAREGDFVLLPRNAAYWRELRATIESRWSAPVAHFPNATVKAALDSILPPALEFHDDAVIFDNAQQRLAASAFVDARIGVLTGGPGTGKTTSAATLLAMRKRLEPELRAEDVLLCAPTGKAACRLADSLSSASTRLQLRPEEQEFLSALKPLTLHKALEWTPKPPEKGGPFRRGSARPLDKRLVLVDEASMVDLALMAYLLRALKPETALLLLGDSDQLESVDTGGVLGELVTRGAAGEPTNEMKARWLERLDMAPEPILRHGLPQRASAKPLPGLVVGLRYSFRAKAAPWVLELADIARPGHVGTAEAFLACCDRRAEHIRVHRRAGDLHKACQARWKEARKRTDKWRSGTPQPDADVRAFLLTFQLLCGSNAQVDRANRLGLAVLWGEHPQRAGLSVPHGCPIIVTQNSYALGLSNGDVGIALGAGPERAAEIAVFPGLDEPIPLPELPNYQPAFALTIHKSQGSEWQTVAIELPDEGELLDRNLLYTAITRSSGGLELYLGGAKTLRVVLEGALLEENSTAPNLDDAEL